MGELRSALLLGSMLGVLACSSAVAGTSPKPHTSSWVEVGPRSATIVRAVTEEESCPQIVVDGRRRTMGERAAPDPPDYPVTTCEHELPKGADLAKLAGRRLALPAPEPERIAVVGDTGCRISTGGTAQACNDPQAWPFKQVAASIAEWEPDLVIHVGDYHYRESPCPEGNAGCAGSPFGYNWASWRADFFQPARRALRTAPWLFIRGNHESCSRAGEGWFFFLDPRPLPQECRNVTAPWRVRTPGLNLVVIDSSSAADTPPLNPEPFVPQFEALPRLAGENGWLLTHRPLWGLASFNGTFNNTNETLQAASGNTLPPEVKLTLAGHLHQAEVLALGPERALQVVAGQGGTELDPEIPPPAEGTHVGGASLRSGEFLWQFGFNTFIERRGEWSFKIRDRDGRAIESCRVDPSVPC
jgi:hypothetical protein